MKRIETFEDVKYPGHLIELDYNFDPALLLIHKIAQREETGIIVTAYSKTMRGYYETLYNQPFATFSRTWIAKPGKETYFYSDDPMLDLLEAIGGQDYASVYIRNLLVAERVVDPIHNSPCRSRERKLPGYLKLPEGS